MATAGESSDSKKHKNSHGSEMGGQAYPVENRGLSEKVDPQFANTQRPQVETEDIIVEESVKDIDSYDEKNPLAVVDYVDDVYANLRTMEVEDRNCASSTYMARQLHINEGMRCMLIDWVIEVFNAYKHKTETFFLSVNVIDRFLSCQIVEEKMLQLVGTVAMLLACKYEEGSSVPKIAEWIDLTDNLYSRLDFLEMERLMLNTLQFNMSVPTPYTFMQRFLKAAQSDEKLEWMAFFLIDLSLLDYGMLKFRPSLLAAAAVYTAQCTLSRSSQWSKTCEWYTGYSKEQLLECSRLMVTLHQKAPGEHLGIHEKYYCNSDTKFEECEPANFLLNCA